MIKFISTISLLVTATIGQSQDEHRKPETVLTSPEEWKAEIIPFPLGFARSIDLVGFEDIRFAPGWSDSTQQDFWAYSFVWYVDSSGAMTEDRLTDYFNAYYNGLMDIDHHNKMVDTAKVNQMPETMSLFVKTEEGFTGKMHTYDRFFTKDYLTLNIKVTEQYCSQTKKQIVRCDISPGRFSDPVWKIFKDVKLLEPCE